MTRGNNRGRGRGNRGNQFTPGPPRGGRGRGGRGGGGRGRGRGFAHVIDDPVDFAVVGPNSVWTQSGSPNPNAAAVISRPPFRGRGRGRGGKPGGRGAYPNPLSADLSTPPPFWAGNRDRGPMQPYVRGKNKVPSSGPLSNLLYAERPLLKPVIFVKSTLTPALFRTEEEESELLKPLVATGNDEDDEPTADQVEKVFRQGSQDEDELEEIDFEDIGRLQEEVDRLAARSPGDVQGTQEVEERFTGITLKAEDDALPEDSNIPPPEIEATVDMTMDSASHEQDAFEPLLEAGATLVVEATSAEEDHERLPIREVTAADDLQEPKQVLSEDPLSVTEEAIDDRTPENEPEHPLFVIDTTPSAVPTSPILTHVAHDVPPLGIEEDEEVIVYDAPNPKVASRPATPPPRLPQAAYTEEVVVVGSSASSTRLPTSISSDIQFSFPQSSTSSQSPFSLAQFSQSPQASLRSKVRARTVARRKAKSSKLSSSFGRLGAMFAEAQLRGQDPRKKERRRDDSDLEWGSTSGDEDDDGGGGGGTAEGMEVDIDLDAGAMKSFVEGMSRGHVTMDDVRDTEKMKEEDEGALGRGRGSSGEEDSDAAAEVEVELLKSEAALIGESGDGGEEDDEDEEEEFEEKLRRLRNHTPSRKVHSGDEGDAEEEDEDEDDLGAVYGTWSDEDDIDLDEDDFFEQMQALVGNAQAASIRTKLRKAKGKGKGKNKPGKRERQELKDTNDAFHSIINGSFEYDEVEDSDGLDDSDDEMMFSMARKRNKKPTHLPKELQEQWEKDRMAKADRKRLRALERLQAASDPFTKKKGGKKGRNDMLRAASLEPVSSLASPNRVIDISTLVAQVRRFVSMIDGPREMKLPPCEKSTRVLIHQIASVFNLKSTSKGKGDARYTTLAKTSRTLNVGYNLGKKDEGKIRTILRKGGGELRGDGGQYDFVRKNGPKVDRGKLKPKEGEIVGKAAPKLTSTNIGFKMLAVMGWQEGDRIGLAAHNTKMSMQTNPGASPADMHHGGSALDAPLTAVVKTTKLGLGANK